MIVCTRCNRASSNKEWNDYSRERAGQPLEATVYEVIDNEIIVVSFVCPKCGAFNSVSYSDITNDNCNLIKEY